MKRFKERWGITSGFQLTIIFLVFALTGSTSAYLSKPILSWIGLGKEELSGWIYYPLYIVLIFPVYQVLLLAYGAICGQFRFFWAIEKKMLKGLGLGFLFRDKKNTRD